MFIYKCTPWCPWENFINFKSFQQCEQHTPMSDMQRRSVTSPSSSAGAQMHTWMGQAVSNVHTQRHLEIFKKFTFLPVPGSSTYRPTMSFYICEVSREKATRGGCGDTRWNLRTWRIAVSTRPARTTQQDLVSKEKNYQQSKYDPRSL